MELQQNAHFRVTRSEAHNLPCVTSCLISKLDRVYISYWSFQNSQFLFWMNLFWFYWWYLTSYYVWRIYYMFLYILQDFILTTRIQVLHFSKTSYLKQTNERAWWHHSHWDTCVKAEWQKESVTTNDTNSLYHQALTNSGGTHHQSMLHHNV